MQPYDLKIIAIYQARHIQPCLELVRLGFDQARPEDFDINTSVAYRLKQLKSADAGVRYRAGWELKEMGPKAKEAVPALLNALDDKELRVRQNSDAALREIVGPESLLLIADAAKDKKPQVRAVATYLLSKFKLQAEYVVPWLLKARKDEDSQVRIRGVAALGSFPEHPGVVDVLIALRVWWIWRAARR